MRRLTVADSRRYRRLRRLLSASVLALGTWLAVSDPVGWAGLTATLTVTLAASALLWWSTGRLDPRGIALAVPPARGAAANDADRSAWQLWSPGSTLPHRRLLGSRAAFHSLLWLEDRTPYPDRDRVWWGRSGPPGERIFRGRQQRRHLLVFADAMTEADYRALRRALRLQAA